MNQMTQNLLIILGLLIVAGLGYYLYTQNSSSFDVGAESFNTDLNMQAQIFIVRSAAVDKLKLDGSVFADPRFTALVDYSQPVEPQPVGRDNPFIAP